MTNTFRVALILTLLRFYPSLAAADLKTETKEAWDAYLQAANAAMQVRLQPGAHFLWLDDEPGRAEKIRTKGPYIAPVGPHIPKKFPPVSSTIGLAWASSLTLKSRTSCGLCGTMTGTRKSTNRV